jgi:hypothetical protein
MAIEGREKEMMVKVENMKYISIFFKRTAQHQIDSTKSTSIGKHVIFMQWNLINHVYPPGLMSL